jgi:hypothetical protein
VLPVSMYMHGEHACGERAPCLASLSVHDRACTHVDIRPAVVSPVLLTLGLFLVLFSILHVQWRRSLVRLSSKSACMHVRQLASYTSAMHKWQLHDVDALIELSALLPCSLGHAADTCMLGMAEAGTIVLQRASAATADQRLLALQPQWGTAAMHNSMEQRTALYLPSLVSLYIHAAAQNPYCCQLSLL